MWIKGNQKRPPKQYRSLEELKALEGYISEKEAKIGIYELMRNSPSFAAELLMGVKLFPFQDIIIKTIFETDYTMGVLSRGGSKSWSTSVYAGLDAILNQGVNIGIISRSFRQCLDKDSFISTPKGIVKLDDLQIGDKVCSVNNNNKVLNKWYNKKEIGKKIISKFGYEFQAKNGHRVYVYDPKSINFKYKNIEDLDKNDILVIHRDFNSFSECNEIDCLDAYMYGAFIGDAYSSDKTGEISLTSIDKEIEDLFYAFCERHKLKYSKSKKEGSNCYSYRTYCKSWVDKNPFICFGKTATNKFIDSNTFKLGKKSSKEFLKGLFDTDGCISLSGRNCSVDFCSSSKQLIKDVQLLLLRFGIISTISMEKARGKIKICGVDCIGRESYKLRLTSYTSILKFYEEIGFGLKRKQDILDYYISLKKDRGNNNVVFGVGKYLKDRYSFPEILPDNIGLKRLNKIYSLYNDRITKSDLDKIDTILTNNFQLEKIKSIQNCEVETVDIEVENEHCYVGNGFVHHNSKLIYNKLEDIINSPDAVLFNQCSVSSSKGSDQWVMKIGKSTIKALPLGDGDKLRGERFHRIIVDEFLLMPESIFNEVIMPFLAVVDNPIERNELLEIEDELIKEGVITEDDRYTWPNNKVILLSSASYKFEYMYELYCKYEKLIMQSQKEKDRLPPKERDNGTRAILHFSYDVVPEGLYDANLLSQSKATMSESQFQREFGAVFTDDSKGYFEMSKMMACTIEAGELPSVEVKGNLNDSYILAFDPSWSLSDGSDDFAIHILKVDREKRRSVVVHSYAIPGTPLTSHMRYFQYLLEEFNVVLIVGDYNGAVKFMESFNETDYAKKKGGYKNIEVPFDKPEEYESDMRAFRMQYNLDDKRIVYLRKPTNQWIRQANELLQANFTHKRIFFGGKALNSTYKEQIKKEIPINEIRFIKKSEDFAQSDDSKLVDFVEHQGEILDLTKTQCALILPKTTAMGAQSFDLPDNLRKQEGPNKTRKDSYSALLLGNWAAKIYFDMFEGPIVDSYTSFKPYMI